MKKTSILSSLLFILFLYSCTEKKIEETEEIKISEDTITKQTIEKGIDTAQLGKYPQIPKEVLAYLKENMNEYEVIDTSNYHNSWELKENNLPFFLKLDFNGDKKEDYALLLMKGQKMRLMLLLNPTYQNNPEEIEFVEMKLHDYPSRDAYEENMIQFMIKYQDKGETYGIGNAPPPIHLKYESIQFIKLGASSSIFYYEDSQIKRFYTGT